MKELFFLTILIFAFSCKKVQLNNSLNRQEFELEKHLNLDSIFADVIDVNFTGNEFNYYASVSIQSPDVDCDQYANWWEVFTLDGTLIYRRILEHSHANEQPFTRSGGSINVSANEIIYIRAYMHPTTYGGKVLFGSIECGFTSQNLSASYFAKLANQAPLPSDCLY